MLNNIESFTESGKRAAQAMNQKDLCRYHFEKTWANRAIDMEKGDDRVAAKQAYEKAFTANRVVPSPCYL